MQQLFEQHPQVDVLFADYLVADTSGRAVALRREIPLRRFNIVNSFLNLQSCTLFFRRSLWDRGLLRLDSQYRYAADKDLVLDAVMRELDLEQPPRPDDAADALAVALTGWFQR